MNDKMREALEKFGAAPDGRVFDADDPIIEAAKFAKDALAIPPTEQMGEWIAKLGTALDEAMGMISNTPKLSGDADTQQNWRLVAEAQRQKMSELLGYLGGIRSGLRYATTEQTGRVMKFPFLTTLAESRERLEQITIGIHEAEPFVFKDLHWVISNLDPASNNELSAPAASLPSVEDLESAFKISGHGGDGVKRGLRAIHTLLTDRLGKSVEVDLMGWIETQGFDDWAADHSAVLRNLKAYLQSAGVRVKDGEL